MSETWIQIIGVGVFVLIVLFGILRMKSPAKGGDAMTVVIEELQKAIDPQVKQIRQAKEEAKKPDTRKKSGSGEDPAKDG
jgi:hypothetical protein